MEVNKGPLSEYTKHGIFHNVTCLSPRNVASRIWQKFPQGENNLMPFQHEIDANEWSFGDKNGRWNGIWMFNLISNSSCTIWSTFVFLILFSSVLHERRGKWRSLLNQRLKRKRPHITNQLNVLLTGVILLMYQNYIHCVLKRKTQSVFVVVRQRNILNSQGQLIQ